MQTTGSGGESECISELISELSRSAAVELNDRKAEPSWISAQDERRLDALRAIDESSFSWFHYQVIMCAGVGFLTDAYDIFAINLASQILASEGDIRYGMTIVIIITILSLWLAGPVLGAFLSVGVFALWKFIPSDFPRTGSLDCLIPTVFTPEGWGNLADSLAALVWGARRGAGDFGNGRQRRAERRRRERVGRHPGG